MGLQEGDRLYQQVVAGADEVHVEQEVVADQAVDSLVVGDGVSGPEVDDYLLRGLLQEHALVLAEPENIPGVSEKLELGLELRLIHDRQRLAGVVVQLDFSEIDGVGAERNIEVLGPPFEVQSDLVATVADHLEMGVVVALHKPGHVEYLKGVIHFGWDCSVAGLQRVEVVREAVLVAHDLELGGHL